MWVFILGDICIQIFFIFWATDEPVVLKCNSSLRPRDGETTSKIIFSGYFWLKSMGNRNVLCQFFTVLHDSERLSCDVP